MSATHVAQLHELFPSWDEDALADVLASVDNNIETAIDTLQQFLQDDEVWEASPGLSEVRCVRPVQEPASPWHGARFPCPQAPLVVSSKEPLCRGNFDRIMAGRLQRSCSVHQVTEILKAAKLWRNRAHAHHFVERHHRNRKSVVALPVKPGYPGEESPSERDRRLHEELSHLSREEAIVAGKELLRQRCKFLGFRMVDMEDDGNCQFRAFAQELFGKQDLHGDVRSRIVAYLMKNSETYSSFFEEHEWEEYIQKMSHMQTWGDELTLRICAEAFAVRIHLLTSTEENWYMIYDPVDGFKSGARELFLTYLAPIHYNTLMPLR